MRKSLIKKPIGIFGGTFDPIHNGHLRLAEEAADWLGLASVCFIPAGNPALRTRPSFSPTQRLAFARLAISGNPRFTLDAAEADSAEPSFTVPTLQRLRDESAFGQARSLVLLLGADAFARLEKWHRWEEIFALAHIALALRPGFSLDAETLSPALARHYRERACHDPKLLCDETSGRIIVFPMTPLDISATQIRRLLTEGKSVRYLAPECLLPLSPPLNQEN